MDAVDTNVLIYAHDPRDQVKQTKAVSLIASLNCKSRREHPGRAYLLHPGKCQKFCVHKISDTLAASDGIIFRLYTIGLHQAA
jgi:hypothetical protein